MSQLRRLLATVACWLTVSAGVSGHGFSRHDSHDTAVSGGGTSTCPVGGLYVDGISGPYRISCVSRDQQQKSQQVNNNNPHHVAEKEEGIQTLFIEDTSSSPAWPSFNATYDPTASEVVGNFGTHENLTGVCNAPTFSKISWNNGVVWNRQNGAGNVTSVHLVFMTHLDLGFTDTTRNVCDDYFDNFFPKAFQTAEELRKRGGVEKFRWTEFPWLIQEYLDGGAGCAHRDRTPEEIKAMELAIAQDDIIWHKTAVNFLPEILDEETWAKSLRMCDELNIRFNKSWGLTGKHTDTPGMSRSAIPALLKAGVKAYHIGYNAACAKNVATLAPAFRWRSNASDHSGASDLLTLVNDNYGSASGFVPKSLLSKERLHQALFRCSFV